ncbi:NAD(P)H-dependent oxidoreductase [Pseudomonas sp. NPDC089554]|uniref:NAD(P)H-dependent oxidoreductase n=1 Tax=Pseudomonas sp. NPDC089554 TaxID=3390653 RepID=UPI003CFF70AC
MHALIVVAHHDKQSLTHALAQQVAKGLASAGHTSEIADLIAEGFDPVFSKADHAVHHGLATPPPDVRAEQTRIDRADTLVLVYPVYWWSMPALLKGWVDRVFSNGWAFGYNADGSTRKLLRGMKVHLLAVAGADTGLFQRHGYSEAMRVQIEHGMFDYCGAQVLSSTLLTDSETQDPKAHLRTALAVGEQLFAEVSPSTTIRPTASNAPYATRTA